AAALDDDVDLVVLVRLLSTGLRGDKHVDLELDARRAVDALVAACSHHEPLAHAGDVERMRGREGRALRLLAGLAHWRLLSGCNSDSVSERGAGWPLALSWGRCQETVTVRRRTLSSPIVLTPAMSSYPAFVGLRWT